MKIQKWAHRRGMLREIFTRLKNWVRFTNSENWLNQEIRIKFKQRSNKLAPCAPAWIVRASYKTIQNKVFKCRLDSMKILLLFAKVGLHAQQQPNEKGRQDQTISQETNKALESPQTCTCQTTPFIKASRPSQKQSVTMNWGTNLMEDVMHPKI